MVDYADESLFLQDSIDKQISIISDDQTINISNDDIVGEEFELTESLCSEDNLIFGTVESSCIRFRVKNTFPKMMKKWLTVTITPHGAEEPFVIGRYYVRKEKPSSDRSTKEITAYDGMYSILQNTYLSWYKTAFDETRQTTVKDFRDAFFTRLAETHPWISQESVNLPNDNVPFKRVKKLNRRDLSGQNILKAICEINGVCGRLGRDNVFHYYGFDNTQNPHVITKALTISVDYEDYKTTAIDRIEFLNEKGGIYAQAGVDSSSANNAYVVENNFLIRGIERERAALVTDMLLYSVNQSGFTPIDAEFKGNPCYEVGDYIQFTANGNNIKSFILQRRMRGIQSLHDFYESQGKKEYPTVSTTTTAKIKTNTEKLGVVETSDYSFVSNLDGDMGDIGYSDADAESLSLVTSDPEHEGKRTMHYWAYNGNLASPYWTTWRGEVVSDNMPFVVVTTPRYMSGQQRSVEVAGKMRKDTAVYLIGRIVGYAGSTLSQYPLEQEYKYVSGLSGGQQFAFGNRWNNMYNIGVTSKEYWYVGNVSGTPVTGLIDEDTPADYEYDSLNDIVTAINNGEIVVDDNSPSDYKMKLPTQKSANELCRSIINLGGVQNQTRSALRSSEPVYDDSNDDFITGSDLMGDNSLKKITKSINELGSSLLSNIKDIYVSIGEYSKGLVAYLFSGNTRWLVDIPSFFVSPKSTEEVNPPNNTLFFNIEDNSGIGIEKYSEHDWGIDETEFSVNDYGYSTEVKGNRDSSETPHQYATLKLSGFGNGVSHTVKLKENIPYSYNYKKTYLMWAKRDGSLIVVEMTVYCSSPFVIGAYKVLDTPTTFVYNGQTYSRYAYDFCFEVKTPSTSTQPPTINVSQEIIYYEQYEQEIIISNNPIHPSEWGSNYYYFPTNNTNMFFGFFEENDIDYVYDDLDDLKASIDDVSWENRIFVYGKPLGVLFSDSATISDFSALPTDRGTWHSTEKFHSFYADVDNSHELTCQFTSTADTMYAHFVMDGLADCVNSTINVGVDIVGFTDDLIDMYVKKLYGKWGDKWFPVVSGGGGAISITPNYNDGINVADYSIDGSRGSIKVPIEANPSSAASANLTKLKVGTNTYGIQNGTEVIPNPSGTPTAVLDKISIGGVVYSIPSGGGGGQIAERNYTVLGQSENSSQLTERTESQEV